MLSIGLNPRQFKREGGRLEKTKNNNFREGALNRNIIHVRPYDKFFSFDDLCLAMNRSKLVSGKTLGCVSIILTYAEYELDR